MHNNYYNKVNFLSVLVKDNVKLQKIYMYVREEKNVVFFFIWFLYFLYLFGFPPPSKKKTKVIKV